MRLPSAPNETVVYMVLYADSTSAQFHEWLPLLILYWAQHGRFMQQNSYKQKQ